MNKKRRQLLRAGLAGAGLLASTSLWAAKGRVLIPGQTYLGGRLLQRITEAGFPDMRPDNFGPMTMFVAPVAVAISTQGDLYVADAGLSALFRFDTMQEVMSVVRGARVTQQTRITAMSDGSVLVANGGLAPVTRYSRAGRVLQTLDPQLGAAYYDELVVDGVSGRFFGLDRVQRRLEEIMPHGRGATVLPEGIVPDQPSAMVMDGRMLYFAGRGCQCVIGVEMFASRDMSVVAEDAGLISAMAAGDGWLVLSDVRDRMLRLYFQGSMVSEIDFGSLGLLEPRGMAIGNRMLYIADVAARRILTFRMRT
jgi:hypothetical protein